jgi:hypothetical protein
MSLFSSSLILSYNSTVMCSQSSELKTTRATTLRNKAMGKEQAVAPVAQPEQRVVIAYNPGVLVQSACRSPCRVVKRSS